MAFFIVTYFGLSLLISLSNGKSNKPSDAVIYEKENRGGNSVSYRIAPFMWENVKNLIRQEGLEQIGHVCVTGTYILYQRPGYYAQNPDQIRILSGKNNCIAPGNVLSYQPIAPKYSNLPVISLFGVSLLRGEAQAIQTSADLGVGHTQEIKSFVLQGKDSWSVLTGNGRTFCLKPNPSLNWPLCMVLDLESTTQFKIPTRWLRIQKGCPADGNTKTAQLKNCIEAYSGKLKELNTSFLRTKSDDEKNIPRARKETGVELKVARNEEETEFDLTPINVEDCEDKRNRDVVDLLAYVLSNDFSSNTQVRYPRDKKLLGILYSIELSFDILLEFCSLTSPKFLQIVRELYIEQMEAQIWSKISVDDLESMHYNQVDPNLDKMLTECQSVLRSTGKMRQFQRMSEVDLERKKLPIVWRPRDFNWQIGYLGELPCGNTTNYNTELCTPYYSTQEALHLVLNTVAAACHVAFNFTTNFYLDYAIAFKSFYLDPLTDHWIENRINSMKMDQIAFAGMSVVENLQGLGICAGNVFHGVPRLGMYDRDIKLSDPLRKKKK